MKRNLLRCLGLTFVLILHLNTALSADAQQPVVSREGVRDLTQLEASSLASKLSKDSRYEALRRVADERGLHLALARAAAKSLPRAIRLCSSLFSINARKKKDFWLTVARCGPYL
jgi:monoamine oxidase